MHSEFIELGSLLRERREQMGVSLKEAEMATSIRLSYLESIEMGHLGKLISPIYAQGFIKKYAVFLEIDPEEVFKSYPSLNKVLSDKKGRFSDFNLEVSSIEMRGVPKGISSISSVLWLGIGAMILTATWFVLKHFHVL